MNDTPCSPEDIAAHRRKTATGILSNLELVERWSRFGRPVIVGAYAYDLMLARDIDMEIYCSDLRIEDGFAVQQACAAHSSVVQTQFINALNTPDQALYWQIRCRDEEGEEWKIDMWSAPEDYPLPRAEYLIEPMRRALTPETRSAILAIKAAMQEDPALACFSIHLYRAVIGDGVRTVGVRSANRTPPHEGGCGRLGDRILHGYDYSGWGWGWGWGWSAAAAQGVCFQTSGSQASSWPTGRFGRLAKSCVK